MLKQNEKKKKLTHKVDRAKAAMANLVQVAEYILRVILEEEVGHLWVLGSPFMHGRWHHGMDMC